MTTDELRAKFYTWWRQQIWKPDWSDGWKAWQAAHASRDAEVEALKRDAERYRWLRMSHEKFPSGDLDFTVACGYRESTGLIAVPSNTGMLDAEIDNAMAKESAK